MRYVIGLVLVAFITLFANTASAAQCSMTHPKITKLGFFNYYSEGVWPAVVSARGPNPFSPDFRPRIFSGFNHYEEALTDDPIILWSFTTRLAADGCYEATWQAASFDDGPFSPVFCVKDPLHAAKCANVGRPEHNVDGEVAVALIKDIAGLEAIHSTHPCESIPRGAHCVFP
jgi:hypothetical protein